MERVKRAWCRLFGGNRSRQRHARTNTALRLQLRGVATARAVRQYVVSTSTYARPKDLELRLRRHPLDRRLHFNRRRGRDSAWGSAQSRQHHNLSLWPEGKHLPVPRATKGDIRIESDV